MRIKKGGIVLVVLFAVFFLSTMAWAVDCPIPDTGQTKCYDDTQEITCPQPGEDFYGQDAQYHCNPQSYIKLDSSGNDLSDSATEWVMVRDNVTELIWEVKTDDGSIHDKDTMYNGENASDIFLADLKSNSFGGYSDWRFPTAKELSYIRNLDTYDPTININYFPNTVSGVYYRRVNFHYGIVSPALFIIGVTYYVRAVRGDKCEFSDFYDNGNG